MKYLGVDTNRNEKASINTLCPILPFLAAYSKGKLEKISMFCIFPERGPREGQRAIDFIEIQHFRLASGWRCAASVCRLRRGMICSGGFWAILPRYRGRTPCFLQFL